MSAPRPPATCSECGLALPESALDLGCPGCSLRLALSPDTPTSRPSRPPPAGLSSRFFGDYEILREIARGGMGVVYEARELGLNRRVALKMVPSHPIFSDEARLRLRVEIEAVAQLEHPNIVPLYASGEHEGIHFFTMRLVEGGDLAAQLQRGAPLRTVVGQLITVCRAVHHAHQRGILHRDLKPSNILVDAQGVPHVADFGLARSIDPDGGFTFTSSVLGSPNYMAPEQAAGRTRQLTTAVDVYGLGSILYHAIAGQPPFLAGSPIETLRQVLDREPAPPGPENPAADADIRTIALKCLRKEPEARYASAEALAQDLERWLAGDPIQARPLGTLARAGRWSRRHPVAALLAGALTLAVAALVIGTGLAAARIQQAERRSAHHLRESLLREAASHRLAGAQGHRTEVLGLLRQAAALGGEPEFRARLRDELLAALARTEMDFAPFHGLDTGRHPERHRLDARLELVASLQGGNDVVIRDVPGHAVRQRLTSTQAPITRIAGFSPHARFLALWHDHALSVWDVTNASRCLLAPGTNLTFAFTPDARSILVQRRPNEAVLLDLPDGTERMAWRSESPRLGRRDVGWHTLEFSPSGRWLAGASGTSRLVEIMDPATGSQVRILTNSAHTLTLAWNRSETHLAVATADGRVFWWNMEEGGGLDWATPPLVAAVSRIAVHPTEDWLALGCGDGRVRLVDTLTQEFLFDLAAEADQLVFAPEGDRLGLVWSESGPGFIHMRHPAEFAHFRAGAHGFHLTGARFSPDGRILAVGHLDRVVLVDAEHGLRLRDRSDWRMAATVFHPAEGFLLTGTTNGILRHDPRVDTDSSPASSWRHPETLHPGGPWRALGMTPDGRFLAGFHGRHQVVFVFDRTLTHRIATLAPHPDTASIALSPDGRWLATGSRVDLSVRLWDVGTGQLEGIHPTGLHAQGEFSQDGRWVAVMGRSRFQLLESGSWKPAPALRVGPGRPTLGAATFSPDSRILALVVHRYEVHLVDLASFKTVGILRDPGASPIAALAFSADGTRLAAVGAEARVALWRLDEIRRHLGTFQLDSGPWVNLAPGRGPRLPATATGAP